ncbi:MAG TPA: hypothetical protein VM370_04575 [Candidatus Thermoplasmatota archaeon]|nr:hypothetical protein [Candidatus Thermoplasmatota archaeon]
MRSLWQRLRSWLGRAPEPPAAGPEREPRGKHQGLTVRERLARYKGGHITLAGEVVQSKPELRIANLLFKKKIRYIYEAQLAGATPDFYLPDHNIIIEHWGMDHTKYREKRAMKTRIYLSRGYKLVETEKKDVPYLERALESRLLKVDPDIFER